MGVNNIPKTIYDYCGYDVYFWANEMSGNRLEPIHVHIVKGKRRKNATKVWITENGILLCNNNSKIPQNDLRKVLKQIMYNRHNIIEEWNRFFNIN